MAGRLGQGIVGESIFKKMNWIKIAWATVKNILQIRGGKEFRDHLIPCCHFTDGETEAKRQMGIEHQGFPAPKHRLLLLSPGVDVAIMPTGLVLVRWQKPEPHLGQILGWLHYCPVPGDPVRRVWLSAHPETLPMSVAGEPREGRGSREETAVHTRGVKSWAHLIFPLANPLLPMFFHSLKCKSPLQQGGLEDSRNF